MSSEPNGPIGGLVLAIETAVSGGSICLFEDAVPRAGFTGSGKASRAETLLEEVDALLTEAGVMRTQLNAIAVSAGPGSFTGLRIGISTALGLAAGLDIPCLQIPLFDAIAKEIASPDSLVVAVPMGRSDLCFQRFEGPPPPDGPHSGSLADLEFFLSKAGYFTFAYHSDLEELLRAKNLLADTTPIDIGTNMARYVGLSAYRQPLQYVAQPPIYVQNPRFR